MHVIVGMPDWYTPPNFDVEVGHLAAAARNALTERFPEARVYEFLPIATLWVEDVAAAESLIEIPGVESVTQATSAMERPGAAKYYDGMLSALSAIRSQSGHQRYSWWQHIDEEGWTLPDEGEQWVGGIWPRGPYPSVDLSGRLLREDPAIVRWASPAQISVLSLSMGPPEQLPSEPNDPVSIALTALSASHLIVVAAGNHGPGQATMNPWALGDHVLSVGATDETGKLWGPSSRGTPTGGSGPDVVADGVVQGDIGTSYAAPRVAVMGMLCAAVLSELNAALNQAQASVMGVPLEALAIVDVCPQTLEVEIAETLPFTEIPALPVIALNFNLAVDAFRAVLPSLRASQSGKQGLVNLPFLPQRIGELIRAAAQPLPGAGEWEAGAGKVDPGKLIALLSSLSIAQVLGWLGFEIGPLGHSGSKPAFHADGLTVLMETVTLTRPVFVWDVRHRRFVRGSGLATQRGALDDLRALAISYQKEHGGHVSRILNATLT